MQLALFTLSHYHLLPYSYLNHLQHKQLIKWEDSSLWEKKTVAAAHNLQQHSSYMRHYIWDFDYEAKYQIKRKEVRVNT